MKERMHKIVSIFLDNGVIDKFFNDLDDLY